MNDTFTQILGLVMLYATVHTFFIHYTNPKERTDYQNVVSIAGIISIVLVFIGVMAGY